MWVVFCNATRRIQQKDSDEISSKINTQLSLVFIQWLHMVGVPQPLSEWRRQTRHFEEREQDFNATKADDCFLNSERFQR